MIPTLVSYWRVPSSGDVSESSSTPLNGRAHLTTLGSERAHERRPRELRSPPRPAARSSSRVMGVTTRRLSWARKRPPGFDLGVTSPVRPVVSPLYASIGHLGAVASTGSTGSRPHSCFFQKAASYGVFHVDSISFVLTPDTDKSTTMAFVLSSGWRLPTGGGLSFLMRQRFCGSGVRTPDPEPHDCITAMAR